MLICNPGIIRSAQNINQPHLFNSVAGGFQQPGTGNEYGQASGPGQGHVEPFSAEQEIQVPDQFGFLDAGLAAGIMKAGDESDPGFREIEIIGAREHQALAASSINR